MLESVIVSIKLSILSNFASSSEINWRLFSSFDKNKTSFDNLSTMVDALNFVIATSEGIFCDFIYSSNSGLFTVFCVAKIAMWPVFEILTASGIGGNTPIISVSYF